MATAAGAGPPNITSLLAECRLRMPAYMLPATIVEYPEKNLPRNPNGKIDRQRLAQQLANREKSNGLNPSL